MNLFDLNETTVVRPSIRNSFTPNLDSPIRVAFIGDYPHADDVKLNIPFAGNHGRILKGSIQRLKQNPNQCFFGYVYHSTLGNRKFPSWNDPDLQESITKLRSDLEAFKPNLIVLLGTLAIRATETWGSEIAYNLRGSVFMCYDASSPFNNYKCLASLHPREITKRYEWLPLFHFDITKAFREGAYPDYRPTKRTFDLTLTKDETITRLRKIRTDRTNFAFDIEGRIDQGTKGMTCLSICETPLIGFIIPFDNDSWTLEEEAEIRYELALTLADTNTEKTLQNGIYDNFVLSWAYGMHVGNYTNDTMIAGWELYHELPKGLAVLTSLHTNEPYYKYQRKAHDVFTFFEYCCKDSAVTFEIMNKLKGYLTGDSLAHYRFNMSLAPAMMYMQMRGLNVDHPLRDKKTALILAKQAEVIRRIRSVAANPEFNPNSHPQMQKLFYDKIKFPVQHPKKAVGYGLDKTKRTTDSMALLTLMKVAASVKKFDKHRGFLNDCYTFRKLDKIRQQLQAVCDEDGRLRGSYNIVGTDTERLAVKKSATGKGANLQTLTKPIRDVIIPDPGYHFFQLDLAGADGWTVAARCKQLGDPTMYEDYMAGIKPAKVIALMYMHGEQVARWSREKLFEQQSQVPEDGELFWLYFSCKMIQHGTNYGMGKITMMNNILKNSHKWLGRPIYLPAVECARLQMFYENRRYVGVGTWQHWVSRELNSKGYIKAASGSTRHFFGPKNRDSTLKQAYAHEPQANTSFATQSAIRNLWYDRKNRNPDGSLIIDLLHQNHDALMGQFKIGSEDTSIASLRSYFANPITIGTETLTIPFDGEYGKNWKSMEHKISM